MTCRSTARSTGRSTVAWIQRAELSAGRPGPFSESRHSLAVDRAVDRPILCTSVHVGRPTPGPVDRSVDRQSLAGHFQDLKLGYFIFN